MEKRAFDPLQVVILVLLTLNLALTGSLWLSKSNAPVVAAEPEVSLPTFADDEELSRIANEIRVLYNNDDIDGLYALLDPIAQAQLTKAEFEEQLGEVTSFLGAVESAVFSNFEKTEHGRDTVYVLFYLVRFSDGRFDKGSLRVTAIDRGDHFKLLGFNLFGGTGP